MKRLALFCLWPLAILLFLSFAQRWLWPSLIPQAFALRAWKYVLQQIASPLVTSFSLAITVAVISTLIGLPAGRALALHAFPGKQFLLWLVFLPMISPPLASAMGIHHLFLNYGITDQWISVMLVHLIPSVPYAVLTIMASFSKLDVDLECQARTLGATNLQVWCRITLPAIAPGIALAASLSFIISWSQYLLTLLTGGGRIVTLPIVLVGFERSGDTAVVAAMALVLMVPPVLLFLLTNLWMRENRVLD